MQIREGCSCPFYGKIQFVKRAALPVLLALFLPFVSSASDEVQGSVAEVLQAIKDRNVGKVYAINVQIAAPPVADDSRFIVRDKTGSVVIRRNLDWPDDTFRAGDSVSLRCEINYTASTPAAAYFQNMTLVSRGAATSDEHGNWLVTTRNDESAQVFKLPRYLTAFNVILFAAGLFILFLTVLAWNTLLRHLVDRRSRELTNERLTSFASSLKVEERTRLAVELHDTIAQTLTGVSLEIDAARDFSRTNAAEMERHLDCASRTLNSCRTELRNCMWDLRNQTLEDISMDEAIRRTLAPHLAGAELAVRFTVDRDLFSDNTALAILRIIRELALNAVRHGKATVLRIAGCIEGNRLLFSVKDNGCGFDPLNIPGVEQGHFGLQGVTERVETLGGTLTIDSSPETGSRISISITLPAVQFHST